MHCPECEFDNPSEALFCCKCGTKFEWLCFECSYQNPNESNFCCKCGNSLSSGDVVVDDKDSIVQVRQEHFETTAEKKICEAPDSERKYVTVMFSDLTGYTEMSEKLDPEDVKQITSTIFSELSKIIEKYDGFIEKYIGDAILAVFGAKEAFEDSALRAIKAAREIHTHIETVSPKYEQLIGRQLSMHTGINTGLVVTGEVNYQKGTHGLVGDTINTAARLMSASHPGEIITDHDSHVQTKGYFDFVSLEPVKVKGKAEPIRVYRVGEALQTPKKLHRLHGLRADLIGRSIEMQVFKDAAEALEKGKGSVISVCGTAGTGKSRLVYEFKKTLDLVKFQWFDANAYPHTQNTPYYPLIDLLTKAFGIEENDNIEVIKSRVESSLEGFLGKDSDKVPYIGGLFSIEYPETSEVSPEYWKDQLYSAFWDILKALTSSGPTIICLEDMHWVDPSTIELVRRLISNMSGPLLVICIYRPVITIYTDFETKTLPVDYTELRLRELSPSESQDMVRSLLKADRIPSDLVSFIRESIDGNPFYVEELINSLVDSDALSRIDGQWALTKAIDGSIISTSIQGVIAGRIDRLGSDIKRLLQEASVIGRAFLFDILQRITETKDDINNNLAMLERLDLISAKSIQPTLEYIFKHALTQEVVYNGLLKKERQELHERIGLIIEQLFNNRLQEFYEILAYHFKHGLSSIKAARYLFMAGKKSFSMCALEEAQQYYKEAYGLLSRKAEIGKEEGILLIGLLNEWGITMIWRGAFEELFELLKKHEELAESINDKVKLSMFYSSIGIALLMREELKESYAYLKKSLKLAEQANSQKEIGYACFRLSSVSANLGHLDEAINFVERARLLSNDPTAELPLHRVTLSLMTAYWYKGDIRKLRELGNELLARMKYREDVRYIATAKLTFGLSYLCAGEYQLAVKEFKGTIELATDPVLIQTAKILLGRAYLGDGQYQMALSVSDEVMNFCEKYGFDFLGTASIAFRGFALAAVGNISEGLQLLDEAEKVWKNTNRLYPLAVLSCFYGQLYLNIVEGKNPKSLSFIVKNLRPIIRLAPGAARKSEKHFNMAIDITSRIGAKVLLAQSYMGLGFLFKAQKKESLSYEFLKKAEAIFKDTEATGYLQVTKSELDAIATKNVYS